MSTPLRAHSGARLLWEADPILALATRLRSTTAVSDLAPLRERVLDLLRDFHARLRADGAAPTRAAQAVDVLGALIDQVVTSMPWGTERGWKSVGGLRSQDARHPAERVLQVARAAAADAGLSELVCVVIALGFDQPGRGGEDSQIGQALAQLRGVTANADAAAGVRLSPEATALIARPKAWMSWLPVWVSGLSVAALLAVLFFVLAFSIGAKSDRVYAQIAALHGPAAVAPRPASAAAPRLATALAAQVGAREVFVRDELDLSVVIIPDPKLFEPAGAALRPRATDLLRAVAQVLQRTAGRIQVIGHADGSVPHSARYPSDWDVSVDRARTVQAALRDFGIEGSRITFDGRADVEPLGADDGARAVSGNGRIEIRLLVGR